MSFCLLITSGAGYYEMLMVEVAIPPQLTLWAETVPIGVMWCWWNRLLGVPHFVNLCFAKHFVPPYAGKCPALRNIFLAVAG